MLTVESPLASLVIPESLGRSSISPRSITQARRMAATGWVVVLPEKGNTAYQNGFLVDAGSYSPLLHHLSDYFISI